MYAIQHEFTINQAPDLALNGTCGYRIEGDRIHLQVGEILSHRDEDNLSGTLALEIWALKQPYGGEGFNGQAIAGVSVGRLSGQHLLGNLNFELPFQVPGEGSWVFTLMLREWTGNGYVTRDFMNFAIPFVAPATPLRAGEVQSGRSVTTDNVIRGKFTEKATAVCAEAALSSTTNETPVNDHGVPLTPPTVNNDGQAFVHATEKPVAVEAEAVVDSMPAKAAPSRRTGKKQNTAVKVSLNQADVNEIAAVKGVSAKLAENIISSRPFQRLEDLLNVKGVGAKLLQKVRDFFTL